jgi:hypothetical protein
MIKLTPEMVPSLTESDVVYNLPKVTIVKVSPKTLAKSGSCFFQKLTFSFRDVPPPAQLYQFTLFFKTNSQDSISELPLSAITFSCTYVTCRLYQGSLQFQTTPTSMISNVTHATGALSTTTPLKRLREESLPLEEL